jgi:pyruvate/2-oxoglutarate/acetoin dehydrogenase E1 component
MNANSVSSSEFGVLSSQPKTQNPKPKTYKQALTDANTELAKDPRCLFVGYGITKTHALGTLKNVSPTQLLEMPVAENLMVGAAIGLSLAGRLPVVYIERCDFLLNALDAIVNHLNAIPITSRGEFKPAVIIRIVVGNREKPLFTGHTHTQDFSEALRSMVSFPVIQVFADGYPIDGIYAKARERQLNGISTALFEYKDLI